MKLHLVKKSIIALGVILISLRLFFPVKEYYYYGRMIDPKKLESKVLIRKQDYLGRKDLLEKVSITYTILHICGISVLTAGSAYLIRSGNK